MNVIANTLRNIMEIEIMNNRQLAVFAILTRDILLTGVAPMYLQEKYNAIANEPDRPEYLLDSKNLEIFAQWVMKWGVR
tara:strand:+ start:952 stop:1188 length:237 start_codon:yes stop_codon:yes gene_type:complete